MKWTSLTSAFEENLVNAEIRWGATLLDVPLLVCFPNLLKLALIISQIQFHRVIR